MGLDMYLGGIHEVNGPEGTPTQHGTARRFGRWRTHWGLHTYLVNHFAGGMDKYKQHHFVAVNLPPDSLRTIIAAIESGELKPQPKPPGYDPAIARLIFGEQTADDIVIFRDALAWLETPADAGTRAVYYEAND